MTLTTHSVAGTALASAFSAAPLVGFGLGFISHFLLDALPHWDYKLKSGVEDEEQPLNKDIVVGPDLPKDLAKIACDGLLGLSLSLIIFFLFGSLSLWQVLAGVIGGVLPDFLQLVYMKTRREPWLSLQKFHIWVHTSYKITSPYLGVSFQAAIIILLVIIGHWRLF